MNRRRRSNILRTRSTSWRAALWTKPQNRRTESAVEELSRTAEQVAKVATHQAESVSLTTAALQRLHEGISARSAQNSALSVTARKASDDGASGTAAAVEIAGTMSVLKAVSAKAAAAMATLEERSSQVEEIVDTIEDIADQRICSRSTRRSRRPERANTDAALPLSPMRFVN